MSALPWAVRAAWAGDSNIKGYLRASSTAGQGHWERVLVYNIGNLYRQPP